MIGWLNKCTEPFAFAVVTSQDSHVKRRAERGNRAAHSTRLCRCMQGCGAARGCSASWHQCGRTFLTTSSTYGCNSSVRYAPTPRLSLSGELSALKASLTPKMGSGGAISTAASLEALHLTLRALPRAHAARLAPVCTCNGTVTARVGVNPSASAATRYEEAPRTLGVIVGAIVTASIYTHRPQIAVATANSGQGASSLFCVRRRTGMAIEQGAAARTARIASLSEARIRARFRCNRCAAQLSHAATVTNQMMHRDVVCS